MWRLWRKLYRDYGGALMPENEENGATPEQPAPQGQVAINLGQAGMTIAIVPQPLNLTIDENGMHQIVTQWLTAHPALLDELVKQRLAQKKTELALITDIRRTKLS